MKFKNMMTILFILPLLIFYSCSNKGIDTYTVGVALPLTGQEGAAIYGKNIRQAIDLAIEEINAKGGVKGKKFKAIYEDTKLTPSVAVSAITKLATVDNTGIIIGAVASSSTLAAVSVAKQYKIILISPASTSNEITGVSPYVFRTIAPDVYEAETMAKFAIKQGYNNIGICFVDNAGTRGPAEIFRRVYNENNLKISAFEVIPQGSTDSRAQMTKLIAGNPDAVYLLGYALELGSMIKQFREKNKKTPILSFQVMEEPKVLEIAANAAEGVIFTTPTVYENEASGNVILFIDKYKTKYHEYPGIFSANSYDAVNVIATIINKVGFETEDIRKELPNIRNFPGASGIFDINNNGDSNQKPQLMIIENSKIKKYNP